MSPQNLSGIGDPVLGTYTDSILDWLVDFGKYSGGNKRRRQQIPIGDDIIRQQREKAGA